MNDFSFAKPGYDTQFVSQAYFLPSMFFRIPVNFFSFEYDAIGIGS